MKNLIIGLIFSLIGTVNVFANDISEPKLQRVTCYCDTGTTYSGTHTTEGRTCGARKEDIGKAAIVYQQNEDGSIGDMIGIFIIEDTGSAPRLKNGSIDIYRSSLERCHDWVGQYGDYCYVQIVEGEG